MAYIESEENISKAITELNSIKNYLNSTKKSKEQMENDC